MFHLGRAPGSLIARLTPRGRPLALAPAIVLVEGVRTLIQPVALAVRLGANITAGHLILGITSEAGLSSGVGLVLAGWGGGVVLVAVELGVALVQRYVLCILVSMYLKR